MTFDRAAGVLLHPTSLPGPYGIGDLGREAFQYVDWLAEADVRWWQVLPLNVPGEGNSPYATRSTFAGNTLLVSPDGLVADGLLAAKDLQPVPVFGGPGVDFAGAEAYKQRLLRRAFDNFRRSGDFALPRALDEFRTTERNWVGDWALFAALKDAHDQLPWFDWPRTLALRDPKALAAWRSAHEEEVEFHVFAQFVFARQWRQLREHAASRQVRILGDMPMFVALDSAEVWARRDLFLLDGNGRPTSVAGVPPDYFNADGQFWGNPLYDWDAMEREGYAWWVERVRQTLETVDALRLDHFRGFAAFWSIPAGAATAREGGWTPGPGRALFDAIAKALGDLPFVAEDLGLIDAPVNELRDALGFPGMAVLQFAFSPEPRSSFMPHSHQKNLAVYSGTHDNNTTRGWYEEEASEREKDFVRRYLGVSGHEIHWDLCRAALASVADLAIVPHQDLAGLGSAARMNRPGTSKENWDFRLEGWMLDPGIRFRLAELVWLYGRS
jgi:4-alpha-glucanotransferase